MHRYTNHNKVKETLAKSSSKNTASISSNYRSPELNLIEVRWYMDA